MLANEVIILAGGLGTRLRPVISDLPKPLAPVAGRPFLAWMLDAYARRGFRRAILATGYLGEKVEDAIGCEWKGLEVLYSREDEPLGTGGALRLAAGRGEGSWVYVANGDTYLDFEPRDLEATAKETSADVVVALAAVEDVARYGAVEVEDQRIVRFREKGGEGPGLINAGSYLLQRSVLEDARLSVPFSFEEGILTPMTLAGRVAYVDRTEHFIDIGVPADYSRAEIVFSDRKP
jgi:D-glycero-alpha-D-manno-heptose 1-phosphate guanylyltransferase